MEDDAEETESDTMGVNRCEVCGQELDTPIALKAHLETAHGAAATGRKNPR